MLARHPFVFGGAALAARRQLALLPIRDAAFEVGSLNPALLQSTRHALADFVTVHAIRNDAAVGGQGISPAGDVFRKAARAADDQRVVGSQMLEHGARQSAAALWPCRDGHRGQLGETERAFPSMRNLLENRVLRRAWTVSRLTGSLHFPVTKS